ncbi:hypothetical protein CK203_074214 [Vitis vinifera]|uniref:Reverse transcriptase zinc-binding domain-containing protein n=1 Tax=Vitis vinifera TaxID=29760 RepID=A0A438DTE6_VITVI|nr:hypothetical protein CK203_074214 [Vitis vinifera]
MGRSKGDGVQRKQGGGGGHGVGLWKTLRKEWEVVKSRLCFVVGNGKMIKFWKDIWCGDEPFCVSFPSLFALAVSKDAWVKDVWSNVGKALTLDQLQRRGWALANRCYLYQRHEESIDHNLLHCDKARTLWVLLFSMFGVQWVLPATVKETLQGGMVFCGKKRGRVFGKQVLCAFFGWFGRQGTKLL